MNKLKQLPNIFRKFDNICTYIYVIAFGLFATPYLLRQQIINSFSVRTFLWAINYIALLALFLFILQNILTGKIRIWYIFPVLSTVALFPTQLAFPVSWGMIFLFCCCCIFPQYILYLDFTTPNKEQCIRRFLIFFNCIILIMFITALIDKIADRFIIKQLSSFLSCDKGVAGFAYLNDSEHNRFFSIFGHPLTNAFLFNSFYIINILYNKTHKALLPNYVWTVITLFSLICCGGKTGITIGLIITILTFYKKWQFYFFAVVSITIAYLSRILDNLIYRFTKMPLTTGRVTGLLFLLKDGRFPFHFFQGHGSQLDALYTDENLWFLNTSSEFPLVGHSLRYGIFFALLLLLPPFIYMTIRLWREKRFIDWFFWCLLYTEVNTYNGFSSCLDVSFIFYFLSFILLNITSASDSTPPSSTA